MRRGERVVDLEKFDFDSKEIHSCICVEIQPVDYLPVFIAKCIAGIEADRAQCEAYYISSPSLATALNPIIGYAKAAEIAKESARTGTPIPQLLREKKVLSEAEIARIFTPEFLAGQAD